MKLSNIIGIFVVILTGAVCAMAQSSDTVVKVRPALSVDRVRQGSTFYAAAVLNIDSGYHINSSRPSESYLIATSLKVDAEQGVALGGVIYPAGVDKKFGFSDKPLSVYEGRVVLKFLGRAAASLTPGNHTLHAKLVIQACNDQACLQPKTVPVDIPFEVVSPSSQSSPINGDIFAEPNGKRH